MNHRICTALAAVATALVVATGCGAEKPAAAPAPEPIAAPTAVTTRPATVKPVGLPTRVRIPAIGVDERLSGVGLKADGAMQTPAFGDAGWYDRGPRPGGAGPAVIVAHVHGPAGDDVFARLHELRPGDRITVFRTDGRSTFVVIGSELAAKEKLPYDRIWNDTERPVLRLITCGGTPDPVTRMYPDNTIVYAELAGDLAG